MLGIHHSFQQRLVSDQHLHILLYPILWCLMYPLSSSFLPGASHPSCCGPLWLASTPPNWVKGCHLQAILPPSSRLRPLLFPIPCGQLCPHRHPPPRLHRPHRSRSEGRLRLCREGPGEGGQGGSRCQPAHLLLCRDECGRDGALGRADGPGF